MFLVDEYVVDNRLCILVKANAVKTEIIGYDETRAALKVSVRAPAEDNKANIEIIKFFSKLTGKDVRIVSGKTSKKKVLLFTTKK